MVASKCYGNHLSSEKYKEYNHLNYISFKAVSLYKNIRLPASVKMLEIFLEAICESLFSSYVTFLFVSVASQKPRLFNAVFQSREQVNVSCSQVRRVWRMLRCCHFVLC